MAGVDTERFAVRMTEVKESHSRELAKLQRGYSLERREVEDAFKLEIAQLEDEHIQEKNRLIKQFRKEKVTTTTFFSFSF